MEHSSSRAICSNVSQSSSRHWNVLAVFLFRSALMVVYTTRLSHMETYRTRPGQTKGGCA